MSHSMNNRSVISPARRSYCSCLCHILNVSPDVWVGFFILLLCVVRLMNLSRKSNTFALNHFSEYFHPLFSILLSFQIILINCDWGKSHLNSWTASTSAHNLVIALVPGMIGDAANEQGEGILHFASNEMQHIYLGHRSLPPAQVGGTLIGTKSIVLNNMNFVQSYRLSS
ncbi:hypothetical protein XELAEV_18014396mg [Xenopus laevis]|uniref:Uncharacterized protein n=1 Tax=Xenopus laevis TaxID=8355 RepID=A0A974DH63_XENLA|nr:hypothetical protein XELAEV_18014396mg [Xenopus laevis]